MLSRQRRAVGAYFWLLGVAVGVWVARIPEIQTRLRIDDGRLGVVLLMSAAGALATMPLAGRLAPRFGAKQLAWDSAALICVLLPMIPIAPSVPTLMAVFAAYGAATGIYGVILNALAVHVEEQHARPILSTFHGLFSLGGLAGAALAAACSALQIGPIASLVGASIGIAGIYLVASPWLPEATIDHVSPGKKSASRWSRLPRRLIVLGGFAFLGLVGEGSMGDWSAVYLRRSLGSSAALAGIGYGAFSLGMTTGRFSGDALSKSLGDVTLLRSGAGLAAVGLLAAVLIAHPLAAIIGFAMVGAGLANAVPILYRASARTHGVEPVDGIATTSTIGYLGFLAGPPIIGLIASRTTLGTALGVVASAIGLIAIGGWVVRVGSNSGSSTGHDRTHEPIEQVQG